MPSRRTVLQTSVATVALLAGCANTADEDRQSTPGASPTATESSATIEGSSTPADRSPSQPQTDDSALTSPACDETLQRYPQPYDSVSDDQLWVFELTTTAETVARGEKFGVELRWVDEPNGDPPLTGNKSKFTIERHTSDGWPSIYFIPKNAGWTDEGNQPPEGANPPVAWYEWSFTLSQAGLEYATETNPSYAVCETLASGMYRFVYWGLTPPQEEQSNYNEEYAISTEFEVTE